MVFFSGTIMKYIRLFILLLMREVSAYNLAIIRIVFGILMIVDTVHERGLASAETRWNDPLRCRFPLFHSLKPLPFQWMCFVYFCMLTGAFGIVIGYKFKFSSFTYLVGYVYILLLDKSYWNNHSYLFALITFLLMFSDASAVWSIDSYINGEREKIKFVNYFVIRFQVSLVYFYAGLKKANSEWIGGHSMYFLSEHWVFASFRFLLSNGDIDLYVVHWGGFLIDISVGVLLLIDKTRNIGYVFCALFNLMNSRMFSIGMFPYVMLAVLPIYSSPDWPLKFIRFLFGRKRSTKQLNTHIAHKNLHITAKEVFWCALVSIYIVIQLFLPFSHHFTQGYNTWTNGLYGYSWDMMLHNWKVYSKRITLIANDGKTRMNINVDNWTPNDRWTHHADMLKQLATCVQQRFESKGFNNVQLYFDIWISLNGRFIQRVYDPKVDLVKAEWSPFRKPNWVLPIIQQLTEWRQKLKQLDAHVPDNTEFAFFADFPGFEVINYVGPHVHNAKLQALSGWAVVHIENDERRVLSRGDEIKLCTSCYHSIRTIKSDPFCFAYIYNLKINAENRSAVCIASKHNAYHKR
ncbi:vitamin K-dependent gamma-carboxylase-like protein [Leptotrombidium deliense]|uniref:Vitamin K-dependent gamma-carboxylase-like protein n=1 Tax=Leptotrombidium deliense TaxID=299467 RepID=A0A443SJE3_9ACAR|nr:vitamin K-dependent gamma-carboxylase-like protein [Leptotrombidium deliense]